MNKFEFYKELYFKEVDRKNNLNSAVSLPLGILPFIVTAICYLISNFNYNLEPVNTFIFILSISCAIVFSITNIFYLFKSYSNFLSGYEYIGLPYLVELDKYRDDLNDYYKSNGSDEDIANKEFEKYLENSFVKYTDNHLFLNDKKAKNLLNAKKFLNLTIIVLLIASISFSINFFSKSIKPVKINITNYSTINWKVKKI